jgi:hypothetical protein
MSARKKSKPKKERESEKTESPVPIEIDTHYQLYGKHAWEVEYGEKCPTCNRRIDEFGFCACGSE